MFFWKLKFFGVMKFLSCIFSGQKIHIFRMLGHLNTYFLIRHYNFWSKFFILRFWSSRCLRLLRPCNKPRGQKKIKSTLFHQYSWNSEVETTWISLMGWPHKTSINNVCILLILRWKMAGWGLLQEVAIRLHGELNLQKNFKTASWNINKK